MLERGWREGVGGGGGGGERDRHTERGTCRSGKE